MKVPNGWKETRLSNVLVSMDAGISVNSEDHPVVGLHIGILKTSAVTNGVFEEYENKFVVESELNRVKESPIRGSIIMSRMNTPALVGANAFVHRDCPNLFLPDRLWQLKTNEKKVDGRWLSFVLGSIRYRARLSALATGTSNSMKNITKGDVKSLPILLPPLPEQKAIADLLSTWDSAIEKTERLIAAKESFYNAELSARLSQGIVDRVKLKKFLKEVSTRNRNLAITQVLSVTNSRGFVRPEDQFDRQVASDNLSNYKVVLKGEYAYNPSRVNVGSIARLDGWDEGVLSPMYTVFSIKKNSGLNSELFLHWLNSHEAKQRIRLSAQGSVRETVSFDDFCAIGFPVITNDEQIKLADYFNLLSEEISSLKSLAEKYKEQKRGLMQKLLTGEWRVKIANGGEVK